MYYISPLVTQNKKRLEMPTERRRQRYTSSVVSVQSTAAKSRYYAELLSYLLLMSDY